MQHAPVLRQTHGHEEETVLSLRVQARGCASAPVTAEPGTNATGVTRFEFRVPVTIRVQSACYDSSSEC
eukprot:2075852-Pleurochrysis_carterae.AAC.2